jgi:hypothetical protein
MIVIWIANLLVLFAIAFLIWKKDSHSIKIFFWPGLLTKILAGIGLGLVYTYYYIEGDTFPYFKDAVNLADFAKQDILDYLNFLWTTDPTCPIWDELNFQQPRAVYLSKVASIFSLLSRDNYWIIATYFSFLSFVSSWFLVTEIQEHNSLAAKPAVFAFMFFPSVVFWTSGLIKESLAMAALYFIVRVFLRLWNGKKMSYSLWVILLLAIWVLWNLKYYYLAVLFPVIIAALVYRYAAEPRLKNRPVIFKVLFWFLIFLVPLSVASFVHPNFYPERFLEVIVSNHDAFVNLSSPQDLIRYSALEPEFHSIAKNAPNAFFSGVFRPFLWEAGNVTKLVASIENTFLLILFIGMVYSAYKRKDNLRDQTGWLILIYSFLLCVFLALSTPNFGTLSRYRVGFLPFLVLAICYDNIFIQEFWRLLTRTFSRLVP